MCRLFGLAAGERHVTATFWLLDAPDSLTEQSYANPDGCEVVGFDEGNRVELHKAPVAAWDDPDFRTTARELTSSTFIAHVRHATMGGRRYENTHPFVEGDVAFAHNGAFGGMRTVEAQLGEFAGVVHGDTDSERMFALILKATEDCGGDRTRGIASATTWLAAHVPVLSLNLILATPTELWALRYPGSDELYLLERAAGGHHGDRHFHGVGEHGGVRVRSAHLRQHPSVVVASERMDEHPGWQLLAPGELVHVRHDLRVERQLALDHPPSHPMTLPAGRASEGRGTHGRVVGAQRGPQTGQAQLGEDTL